MAFKFTTDEQAAEHMPRALVRALKSITDPLTQYRYVELLVEYAQGIEKSVVDVINDPNFETAHSTLPARIRNNWATLRTAATLTAEVPLLLSGNSIVAQKDQDDELPMAALQLLMSIGLAIALLPRTVLLLEFIASGGRGP